MNKDDIIRLARESFADPDGSLQFLFPDLIRFATLVAAAERKGASLNGDHNVDQSEFKPDWDTVKAFDDRHNEDTELLKQCFDALNRSDYLGWQLQIPLLKKLKERLK